MATKKVARDGGAGKMADVATTPPKRKRRSADKFKLELVSESLALACDQLGETIAGLHSDVQGINSCSYEQNALDALTTLWRARWELGLLPNKLHVEVQP